mmetsp:Transcript_10196/g.20296  ORF Transcript_10196/g.20296 Transcript_10196/m.20296 type:complete len:167 (-) Transcript_10196:32-532(-)
MVFRLIPVLAVFLLAYTTPAHGLTTPIGRRRAFLNLASVPAVVFPSLTAPSAAFADSEEGDAASQARRSRVLTTSKYLKAQSSYVTSNDYSALKASLRSPPFDTFRKTARSPSLSESEQKLYDTFIRDIETLDTKLGKLVRGAKDIEYLADYNKAVESLDAFANGI